MATRTVSVKLEALVGGYIGGINQAAAATMRLGESASASTKKAQSGFDLAGKSSLIMGAAVVGGLAMAVNASMKFEKSMSAVSAATQATGANLNNLRDAAMKAGADTAYSATEAADAITEMGKAGVSAKDIMSGGLTGALSLAAAGQIEVAEAAGIASTAMTQFGLAGRDLPHVADLLAAGAGKAMGSVEDLGMALNQAGLVASAAGLSLEETTGTLAAMASAGLVGSDAGTALKSSLQKLAAPSKEAAGMMAELGINAYDTSGNFVGLQDLAGQLHDRLGGLTQAQRDNALATIFGSDAVRAANVLYKEGASGIADWTQKVNDAGYAAKTAAQLQDNLAGDLEKLGGSFETLMINLGSGAQGPLRELVQMLGGLVDGVSDVIGVFSGLPGPVQAGVLAFGAWMLIGDRVSGVLRSMSGSLGPLREGWSAFGEAMNYARANGDGLGTVLRSVGDYAGSAAVTGLKALARAIGPELGVAAAVWVVSEFVKGLQSISGASAAAESAQQGFLEVLRQTNGVMDETSRKGAQQALVNADLVHILNEAGVSSKDAVDGLLGVEGAQDRVTRALQDYITANPGGVHNKNAEAARVARNDYLALAESLGMSKEEAEFFADAALGAADATSATGAAAEATVPKVDAAAEALQNWLEHLQQIGAGFVEPVAIYQGLLQQVAQSTADKTADAKDSWQDYADSSSVSLDQFAQKLQDQITAQENWRRNLVTISQRGGTEVAQILADMGVEGAGLVQQMVDANGEDFARLRDLMVRDAHNGGAGAAAELDTQMKVMAAVGARGASATATGIAQALGLGVQQVADIAKQYGVTLASGINPLLVAVGKGRIPTLNGQRVPDFWDGGFTGAGGKYTPAGIVHKGEFVMPQEAVDRIGVSTLGAMAGLPGYARGGFVTAADVPHPSSTAPFQMPISTAGDATMQKEYDETRAFVQAHMEPPAASGGSSTGLLPIMAAARQYAMDTYGIRNIGGFANRNIAGTKVKSDHAMGKAIDIMTTNLGLGWQIANDFAHGYASKKFNIENTIWQQSISSRGGPFSRMADRGSITQNHGDHIHADTYQTGTPYVPKDGLAYLHEGEAVVPKHINARSREFSGASGGSTAAPRVVLNVASARVSGQAKMDASGIVHFIDGRIDEVVFDGGSNVLSARGVRA